MPRGAAPVCQRVSAISFRPQVGIHDAAQVRNLVGGHLRAIGSKQQPQVDYVRIRAVTIAINVALRYCPLRGHLVQARRTMSPTSRLISAAQIRIMPFTASKFARTSAGASNTSEYSSNGRAPPAASTSAIH